jgi:hypothetical protein
VAATGGLLALVAVVVANLVRPGLARARMSTGAAALGWLVILGLFLGGLYFVVAGDLTALDSAGLAFIVAIPAAGAVVLALMTRHDGGLV